MMLIVLALTGLGFYLAQRHVANEVRRDLQNDFQAELDALHQVQDLRNVALSERCRILAGKPRIHAALEDNALDLLYPSAKDELRDLMQEAPAAAEEAAGALHARFYRFLDNSGRILHPPDEAQVGFLDSETESALALEPLPGSQQVGYFPGGSGAGGLLNQVVATPIFSSETGEVISALVVGFEPMRPARGADGTGLTSGIWTNHRIQIGALSQAARQAIENKMEEAAARSEVSGGDFELELDGVPHLLFYKRLNPDSLYPAAYEICVYPLTNYRAWQWRLLWRIATAGILLLLGGFLAIRLTAARLAVPVEQLEMVSEQNRTERQRAEAALESTSEELERTARYSADASHQLKSPVAILRAGLESLLKQEGLKPEFYDELSAMLHQTYRLTSVIDDLLLLARMDAGKLQIAGDSVDLNQLVNEWADDISALSTDSDLQIELNLEPVLFIAGERRYTSLIIQNLLENARKYNRQGGRISVVGRRDGSSVILRVGNTGKGIPEQMREHLFMRFQRGVHHPDVSGHGLGLSLARDLARLHGGDLRLLQSANDWTEFEARFRAAMAPGSGEKKK